MDSLPTQAQLNWLEANKPWEIQQTGDQGAAYISTGLLYPDGSFVRESDSTGVSVEQTPSHVIRVGVPS